MMPGIFPCVKPNPGGQMAPEQIFGRDALIADMWEILEGRSIYMSDLRRIGKTQILVKMHEENPDGWVTTKHDLGGLHSAAEFATEAFRSSSVALSARQKTMRSIEKLLGGAAGVEIKGILKLPDDKPAPWKEVLRRTFVDIDEAMKALGPDHRFVFLWDEVPFLLDNISKRESPNVAMEVLDVLRALGQDHDRVRLLLTGSIGIHHVLNGLKKEGYNGSPLNRMESVQPGPLAPEHGTALATALIVDPNFNCSDATACAVVLSELVGHVPFYIHKLVSRLPKTMELTPGSLNALLEKELKSPRNDWDFKHYRDRLKVYYGGDEAVALAILDALALGHELNFAQIHSTANSTINGGVEKERLRKLLENLCLDHYITRSETNGYRFYLTIIKRWWGLSRDL
jgi:hypothetical protein